MEISGTQQNFINEATHLGLASSVIQLPDRVVLVIDEPVDDSPGRMGIEAVKSVRGFTHKAFVYDYDNKSRAITLRAAGYKMLEWVGR